MYVCELLFYPPEGRREGGWGFALSKPEKFESTKPGIGRWHVVPNSKTLEFLAWWEARHYSVSEADETSVFQISAELAVELLSEWA